MKILEWFLLAVIVNIALAYLQFLMSKYSSERKLAEIIEFIVLNLYLIVKLYIILNNK